MTKRISVIIPLAYPNDYIFKNIEILSQLASENLEVIILPNEKFEVTNAGNLDLRIIETGKLGPADKRDIGVKNAKYEIVAFLDDDSYPSSGWPESALKFFDDPTVSAVGGPAITPPDETFWARVSGAFFLSPLGGGSVDRYVAVDEEKEVDDWPSVNLMMLKDDFLKIGGFNTAFWPGEDTKLCLEIVHSLKKKIIYDPCCQVFHYRRPGLMRHLKQVGGYGLHRGFFAKKYPETSFKLKYFIPSIFVLSLLFAIFALKMSVFPFALLTAAYIFGLVVSFYYVIKRDGDFLVTICSAPYVFLSHLCYGLNFIKGFVFTRKLVSKLR